MRECVFGISTDLDIPLYEDEYFIDLPVQLTDEQFDRCCKAAQRWYESGQWLSKGWISNKCVPDEELFEVDLPDVYALIMKTIRDKTDVMGIIRRELSRYSKKVQETGKEEDNITLFTAEEIWDAVHGYSEEKTEDYRYFKIEVRVESPYEIDEKIEIELGMTQKEIDTLVDKSKKFVLETDFSQLDGEYDDLSGPWEYIENFLPLVNRRANKIVEPLAVAKWGKKMRVINGARYSYYLPDEISDAIFESEEIVSAYKKRNENSERAKKRFYDDWDFLQSEITKERWGNRLIKVDDEIFSGISNSGRLSDFFYETHIMIEGVKHNLSYQQTYCLNNTILRLDLSVDYWKGMKITEKIPKIMESVVESFGYPIIKSKGLDKLEHFFMYVDMGADDSGVEIFSAVLDELVKL